MNEREDVSVNLADVLGETREKPLMFQSTARPRGGVLERNRAPWTADDIDRLCDMMARRRPIREIAGLLGRTQEAVRTKAYQLDRLAHRSL